MKNENIRYKILVFNPSDFGVPRLSSLLGYALTKEKKKL
jgi:hypothetical protein